VTRPLRPERLPLSPAAPHVEIARLGGDAIDGAFLPQKSPTITRTCVPSVVVTFGMSLARMSW